MIPEVPHFRLPARGLRRGPLPFQWKPTAKTKYEDIIPRSLIDIGRVAFRHTERFPSSVSELFNLVSAIDSVCAIHYYPERGEDEIDQVWVVLKEVTPHSIRSVTDMITEVELEFDEIYEIRIAHEKARIPDSPRFSLMRK